MHRGYLVLVLLILSSLACGLIGKSTPNPTQGSRPTEAMSTQVPSKTPSVEPSNTPIPSADITAAPTKVEQTKTPFPTSALDSLMTDQIDEIQSQVIEERGLQPKFPVPVILLSPTELRQNVTNDFLADYTDEEMANDILELSIIGLLDPGFDFKSFYTDLLSEQVAGYYDNDTSEMFVVQGEGFKGPEHLTYAHEYTHVLQDQTYDIKNGLNYSDETCEVDTERCAAIQALIEGDASLSEYTWFYNYSSSEDQQEIIDYINSMSSPVYDQAPAFMKEDFVFPYTQGFTFVEGLFNVGGWSAVDAAYQNPPVSTEQILHPELYPSDAPIPVDLADMASTLGDGWREASRNQMGEWYTYLILAHAADANARLDDIVAQDAAAGWGGDEYLVLHNDVTDATAFVMKTVWDTPSDAEEFANAVQQYADNRFGVSATQQGDTLTWSYPDGHSSLYHSGDTTVWIIAPDSSTVQTISDSVQP
ncbi:MAG: hypothetical protein A2029_11805 [Chloroflexi bacterium RBG_19FT_COMBO_47_9]|nr:MAG: hypothetical protein A2029_11805 [Chloroflexi bacterium RBG_19FT_COMBO_47_9]